MVNDPFDLMVDDHLADPVNALFVVRKCRACARPDRAHCQGADQPVEAVVGGNNGIGHPALSHTGLVRRHDPSHFLDEERDLDIGKYDRRSRDHDPRELFFGNGLSHSDPSFEGPVERLQMVRPYPGVHIRRRVHDRHTVGPADQIRHLFFIKEEPGQLIGCAPGHAHGRRQRFVRDPLSCQVFELLHEKIELFHIQLNIAVFFFHRHMQRYDLLLVGEHPRDLLFAVASDRHDHHSCVAVQRHRIGAHKSFCRLHQRAGVPGDLAVSHGKCRVAAAAQFDRLRPGRIDQFLRRHHTVSAYRGNIRRDIRAFHSCIYSIQRFHKGSEFFRRAAQFLHLPQIADRCMR